MVRTHRRTSRHDPLQGGNWFQIPETVSLLNTVYKQVETKAQNRGPTTHKDVFGLFQLLKISVQNASESIKRLVPIIFMSFVYHTFPVAWARAFNSKYGILGLKEQSVLHNLILQKNKEKVLSAQKVEQSDTDYAFYLFDFLETMDATHSHLEGGFEWPEWFTLPRNYQLLKAIKEEVAVAAKTVTKTGSTTLEPEPGFVQRIRSLFTQLTTSVRLRSTSVINWVKIIFMAFVYSVFPRSWAKYMNEQIGILDRSAIEQMETALEVKLSDQQLPDNHDYAFMLFEKLQTLYHTQQSSSNPHNKIQALFVTTKNEKLLSREEKEAKLDQIQKQYESESLERDIKTLKLKISDYKLARQTSRDESDLKRALQQVEEIKDKMLRRASSTIFQNVHAQGVKTTQVVENAQKAYENASDAIDETQNEENRTKYVTNALKLYKLAKQTANTIGKGESGENAFEASRAVHGALIAYSAAKEIADFYDWVKRQSTELGESEFSRVEPPRVSLVSRVRGSLPPEWLSPTS